jgi:hypothetical protein
VSLSEGPNGQFEPGRRRPSAKKSTTNGRRHRSAPARKPEPPRWQPAYYGGFQPPEPEPEPAPEPAPEPPAEAAPTKALAVGAAAANGTPPGTEPPAPEPPRPRRPLSTRVRLGIAGLALLLGLAGMLTFALRPGRQVVNPVPAAETPVPPAGPGAAPPAALPPPAALVPPARPTAPGTAGRGPHPPMLAPKAPRPPTAGISPAPHLTVPAPRRPTDSGAPARHAPADSQVRTTRQPSGTVASDSNPDRRDDEHSDGHRDEDPTTRTPQPPGHDDDTTASTDFLDILGSLRNVLPGLG